MKLLIVEDEELSRQKLYEVLNNENDDELEIVGVCDNTKSAYELILEEEPDIIFLDIHMPGESGLEFARRLKIEKPEILIVFTTAFSQYAHIAFDINAVDYILKPYSKERIINALYKLKSMLVNNYIKTPHILVIDNNIKLSIPVSNIKSVEADWKQNKLIISDDLQYNTYLSLTDFENQYNLFIRIHRSTLINKLFIHKIFEENDVWYVSLKGLSQTYQVSRRMFPNIKSYLLNVN